MVFYKTDEEIELIRENCLMVSKALALIAGLIQPGMVGSKLDKVAEEFIRDNGAVPGFKDYGEPPFPATLCISRNENVVHGIPDEVPFKDGDIVSIDCGVYKNGYYGDAAWTFALGNVAEETMELLRVTHTALYKGIEQAVVGKRLGDIGFAIQYYCERVHNYGIVRELVGHGLGRNLHESPEVPNYGKRGRGPILKDGLVIAIEPMVNMGRKEIRQSRDKWTVYSRDKKPSAHFEHSVVVRKEKADILSDHSFIRDAINKNPNVQDVELKEEILVA